jgi:hypothetical protein
LTRRWFQRRRQGGKAGRKGELLEIGIRQNDCSLVLLDLGRGGIEAAFQIRPIAKTNSRRAESPEALKSALGRFHAFRPWPVLSWIPGPGISDQNFFKAPYLPNHFLSLGFNPLKSDIRRLAIEPGSQILGILPHIFAPSKAVFLVFPSFPSSGLNFPTLWGKNARSIIKSQRYIADLLSRKIRQEIRSPKRPGQFKPRGHPPTL